jgi:hypothetical protein
LLLRGRQPGTVEAVVSELTAVQAQEHPYARWSVAQRCAAGGSLAPAVDRAFDDGRILRTHILRPTWHYVAPTDLRWLTRLSGPRLASSATKRFTDLGLDRKTLARSTDLIAGAVSGGPRTRHELAAGMTDAGIAVVGQRLPHILMNAEINAAVTSGPMRGKQHTYAAFDDRVPAATGPEGEEALSLLAWRYFSTRGPATVKDFGWWAGLKAAEARMGLDTVSSRLESCEYDGRILWFVDNESPATTQPQVDLIQCFDELILSYSESRDVLHTVQVSFRTPLNLDGYRHVLVLDGRLVGHWRVTGAGRRTSVEARPARELDPSEQTLVSEAVERYRQFAQSTSASSRSI